MCGEDRDRGSSMGMDMVVEVQGNEDIVMMQCGVDKNVMGLMVVVAMESEYHVKDGIWYWLIVTFEGPFWQFIPVLEIEVRILALHFSIKVKFTILCIINHFNYQVLSNMMGYISHTIQ